MFNLLVLVSYHGLKLQKPVSNVCHDFLLMSPDIDNFAIITIKGADYLCTNCGVTKFDVTYLLNNFVSNDCGFI